MALMSRTLVAALTAALIIVASPSAQAQGQGVSPQGTSVNPQGAGVSGRTVGDAAAKALVERRIEVVKMALALKPEQQKLWPAVEDAIRARAAARHERLTKLIALRNSQDDLNPIDVMRQRANALIQKGTALNKLADAWQPLYATLDDNQKERLAFLAAYVVRELRHAAASRMMAVDEEYEDSDDED
jgi:hypothetical protein